jgi:hypothetical protein
VEERLLDAARDGVRKARQKAATVLGGVHAAGLLAHAHQVRLVLATLRLSVGSEDLRGRGRVVEERGARVRPAMRRPSMLNARRSRSSSLIQRVPPSGIRTAVFMIPSSTRR